MVISGSKSEELSFKLRQYFRPSLPINRHDLFRGREKLIGSLTGALNQDGRHVVIYGERGVGKTSLANMIALDTSFGGPNALVVSHINCESLAQSGDLWKELFREVEFLCKEKKIKLSRASTMELVSFHNLNRVTGGDAQRITRALAKDLKLIYIFDEFDMLEDEDAKRELAETIKLFSDRNAPATIVIVGVADDIENLVKSHQSIERCVSQLKLPRMSKTEIENIIVSCLDTVEMTIEKGAIQEISRIAKGLPHYAHLLGLHTGLFALQHFRTQVVQNDVRGGVTDALDNSMASIERTYQMAVTSSSKVAQYREILLACAVTVSDEFGYFSPTDVCGPLTKIKGAPAKVEAFGRHLHSFCEPDRGSILKKASLSTNRARFRFGNPLLEPYVLMKGLTNSQIKVEDIPTYEPRAVQLELFPQDDL